jgi:hypothetical protein
MKTIQLSPVTKYILGWLPLPGIAIFNGILRELTYSHVAGEQLAQQISSILLSLLVMLYVVLLNSHLQLKTVRESVFVGLIWLLLTVCFEMILGLVVGTSFREQAANYNIFKGNFWPLVLLSVLLSPTIFRKKSDKKRVHIT